MSIEGITISDREQDLSGEANPDRLNAAATEVLLAEFQFVSGLIPFYRRVELTALGGTGIVISAVVAAVAALEAADTPQSSTVGLLLCAGAWAPVFLLMLENMALTRLRRASLYIGNDLHRTAKSLTGRDRILCWEHEPAKRLMEDIEERRETAAGRSRLYGVFLSRRMVETFTSSTSIIFATAATSVAFAAAGIGSHFTVFNLALGGVAAILALLCACYGLAFSWLHEHRVERVEPQKPGGPEGKGLESP